MHWTQTPEGKRKMSAAMKRGWARRRKADEPVSNHQPQSYNRKKPNRFETAVDFLDTAIADERKKLDALDKARKALAEVA